jgi:hypothetical protein
MSKEAVMDELFADPDTGHGQSIMSPPVDVEGGYYFIVKDLINEGTSFYKHEIRTEELSEEEYLKLSETW